MLIIVWASLTLNPIVVKWEDLAISLHAFIFNRAIHACMSLATVWSIQKRFSPEHHLHVALFLARYNLESDKKKRFVVTLHLLSGKYSRNTRHYWQSQHAYELPQSLVKIKCSFEKFFTRTVSGGQLKSRLMVLGLGVESSGTVTALVKYIQRNWQMRCGRVWLV